MVSLFPPSILDSRSSIVVEITSERLLVTSLQLEFNKNKRNKTISKLKRLLRNIDLFSSRKYSEKYF